MKIFVELLCSGCDFVHDRPSKLTQTHSMQKVLKTWTMIARLCFTLDVIKYLCFHKVRENDRAYFCLYLNDFEILFFSHGYLVLVLRIEYSFWNLEMWFIYFSTIFAFLSSLYYVLLCLRDNHYSVTARFTLLYTWRYFKILFQV